MEPYDTNTGVHNRVQITIDLNELVWARGEYLKQDMSVTQNDYLAETLRRTLTWDTLYSMIDQTILEFFENHEHPEIWDCLLYTSPSPRDRTRSRMPSSA